MAPFQPKWVAWSDRNTHYEKKLDYFVEKGVKAAGPRARKSSLELEKLFKEFRKVSVEAAKK